MPNYWEYRIPTKSHHFSLYCAFSEVDPKSQLPVWIHMYELIRTCFGSWSQISTSYTNSYVWIHMHASWKLIPNLNFLTFVSLHSTPLHSPLHSPLQSVCNSYVGTLPQRTSWEWRQSKFATTSLRYMCVMFCLSGQVSTKRIILCTNLIVIHSSNLLHPLINVLHWYTVKYSKNTKFFEHTRS